MSSCVRLIVIIYKNMTNILKSSVIPQKKVSNQLHHTIFLLLWVPPQDLETSLITIAMPKERKVSVNGIEFQ
jgi:hypothetical protein